ncbi:MAG: tRNA (5-methylaminomethyl-2-thiouridine)(34)-methyltransferase MnmD [Flavobacteriales bacterium]
MSSARAVPQRTADGSFTLLHTELGATYHSTHGAVQESAHVFVQAGLAVLNKETIDLLEVGLGTGLNLLLTWIRCFEGKCRVNYSALEPYPLDRATLEALGHAEELAWPGLHAPFLERMCGEEGAWQPELGGLRFRRLGVPVQEFSEQGTYDLIYFDAFAPSTQPALWSLDVMGRMHDALRPGGVLVTYCAKGEVRRTMQAAGLSVERLPGPPGKREMMRATRR